MTSKQKNEFAESVIHQLRLTGENPEREGLLRTPERVAESMDFLTSGYASNPMTVLNEALFDAVSDEMVIVKDIDFYSLCEHHMLPFFGKCHIAYIPRQKVIGLSKLPRLVDVYARRLQIQERMTYEIATTVKKAYQRSGGRRGDRGTAPVHDDARSGETEFVRRDFDHAGHIPQRPATRSEFLELLRHKRGDL
jgi:GTP cyclohydrolase I